MNGDLAAFEHVMVIANFTNKITLILRIHRVHGFVDMPKPATMVVVGIVQRSLKCFGVHLGLCLRINLRINWCVHTRPHKLAPSVVSSYISHSRIN